MGGGHLEMHFIYLGNNEIYWIFNTYCIIPVSFPKISHLFHDSLFFCSKNTFFMNHVVKFKYQPGHLELL